MEVHYPGPRGAFAEVAAKHFANGSGVVAEADVATAIAHAAAGGRAAVPIESSVAGPVPGVRELICQQGVSILDEHWVPVRLVLVGPPTATLAGVRRVASHPIALAQCRAFLGAHPSVVTERARSTAAAVVAVLAAGDPTFAAIAAREAAALHGGRVLLEAVEDPPGGRTRFLLLGPGAR